MKPSSPYTMMVLVGGFIFKRDIYTSGLLHRYWGNRKMSVSATQPWMIGLNRSHETKRHSQGWANFTYKVIYSMIYLVQQKFDNRTKIRKKTTMFEIVGKYITTNRKHHTHYSGVIMGTIASEITGVSLVTQPFVQTQIEENIKAPRHWWLCGEFTGDWWILAQRASNAENVSIWRRHQVYFMGDNVVNSGRCCAVVSRYVGVICGYL